MLIFYIFFYYIYKKKYNLNMDIKGTIKFTENGFTLNPYNGEKEIWQVGINTHEQYIYLNGTRYKWNNQPKKIVVDETED